MCCTFLTSHKIIAKVTEARKTSQFNHSGCEILNKEGKVIAFASRVENLYHLEYCHKSQEANTAEKNDEKWHCRCGHLGEAKISEQ